jgi:hypothetical protein
MLRSLDTLEEGFRKIVAQSKEECSDALEKIRQLSFVGHGVYKLIKELPEEHVSRYMHSLVFLCFLEISRTAGHVLFLSCNGLYRNAFNNIRYFLESVIQGVYMDLRHPKTDFETKIEILKEVEDKWEYRVGRLVKKLEVGFRKRLRKDFKKEYKHLNRIIHPTYEQPIVTLTDVARDRGVPATVDCEEISRIYDSTRRMYDIFFFLFIQDFPETKEWLQRSPDLIKDIKVHDLTLLPKLLKVRS